MNGLHRTRMWGTEPASRTTVAQLKFMFGMLAMLLALGLIETVPGMLG